MLRRDPLRARSTNNVTAAESLPASASSEGTSHNCSSATPSPSRLMVTILTVADCAQDVTGTLLARSNPG
jgi:hypothetical protein